MVMIFVGANYTCTFLLLLGNIILLAKVLLHILVVVFRMNYEKDENTARHTKPGETFAEVTNADCQRQLIGYSITNPINQR